MGTQKKNDTDHNSEQNRAERSPRAVRARRTPNLYPTEDEEQIALAKYLDQRFGYYGWIHVPNQRWAKPQYLRKLNAMGVKKGFPDIIIFESVSKTCHGLIIEQKRQKGGRVRPEQLDWLRELNNRGWLVWAAKGAQDAINKIKEVYGK